MRRWPFIEGKRGWSCTTSRPDASSSNGTSSRPGRCGCWRAARLDARLDERNGDVDTGDLIAKGVVGAFDVGLCPDRPRGVREWSGPETLSERQRRRRELIDAGGAAGVALADELADAAWRWCGKDRSEDRPRLVNGPMEWIRSHTLAVVLAVFRSANGCRMYCEQGTRSERKRR